MEPLGGCTDDLDCKGDRVCEEGVCVGDDGGNGGNGGAPSATTTSSASDSSSSSSSATTSQTVGTSTSATSTGATSSTATTGVTVGSTTSAAPSSTASGDTCELDTFFVDPACDACALANCCTEAENCLADYQDGGTSCLDFDGDFNPNGALANMLFSCLDTSCTDECGGGDGVCGTGLTYNDAVVDACIDESCCTSFRACVGIDGSNAAACNACISAGGGPLCDDYLECTAENGCFGWQVCESNLLVNSEDVATCLGDNCCDVVTECFGTTEEDFDACLDCLLGDGGPLCDAVSACDAEYACELL